MENISISTTQNVNIDYQLASVGDRIFAYILDGVIQFFYIVILLLVLVAGLEIKDWWLSLFFLPIVFYHLLCEAFLNGQSFGKMLFKIRVAKINGGELRFIDCFLRWLFRLVDFNLPIGGVLVGLLTIVIGGKGQRIGDLVAKTTVIKINPKGSLAATAYVEVEADYVPKYPEVSVLSDVDMQTIKEVLTIASRDNSYTSVGAPHPLVLKTKDVVAKKMKIETEQPSKEFLETILKDYNYYHR
ncbi:RDD family protein [Carboxylicivirga taeanensis]|uniref:RDD family protein n=1 Tax=Carboxylicivirga taeanensis TaxID=1416875 RepID=UPI003F6E3236